VIRAGHGKDIQCDICVGVVKVGGLVEMYRELAILSVLVATQVMGTRISCNMLVTVFIHYGVECWLVSAGY
jgi:hypothetical protein